MAAFAGFDVVTDVDAVAVVAVVAATLTIVIFTVKPVSAIALWLFQLLC